MMLRMQGLKVSGLKDELKARLKEASMNEGSDR